MVVKPATEAFLKTGISRFVTCPREDVTNRLGDGDKIDMGVIGF